MPGERRLDDITTIALRIKIGQLIAIDEIARREERDTVNSIVRVALSSFLIQYSEANPTFKDFLHDIALRALLGDTALNDLGLITKPEEPSSST